MVDRLKHMVHRGARSLPDACSEVLYFVLPNLFVIVLVGSIADFPEGRPVRMKGISSGILHALNIIGGKLLGYDVRADITCHLRHTSRSQCIFLEHAYVFYKVLRPLLCHIFSSHCCAGL